MINSILNLYYQITTSKKTWKPIQWEMYRIFQRSKRKVFVLNLKKGNNSLLSRAISYFSKGYTHTVMLYFPKDIYKETTLKQQEMLKKKLKKYYHNPPTLDEVSVWVWASADQNGMNYFDYSKYQKRKGFIAAIPTTKEQEKTIKDFFLNKQIAKAKYDYTGLGGFPLNILKKPFVWIYKKVFDKKKDWFCSEITREGFKRAGIIIGKDNDSPGSIAECTEKWKYYEQL